ncbi:hypothetical protein [Belnapia sp. F-4-1]|uniref:hypothetical protein n=1 Tax=Belnapia sp. F-4-1 TaxID=1545443 RepID=UPI0005BB9E9A|nr:hypothetical protein [Belnapia sp. F-4-1]
MIPSRAFFLVLSVLIAVTGLFAAAAAHDYLQAFGLGLFGFGTFFAFGCIKRHFDEREAAY